MLQMTKNGFNLCLKQLVRSSISDLIDTLMKTRGMAQGVVPTAMQNAINSEACRGEEE